MSIATLRVGGPQFDVDSFLQKNAWVRTDVVWRRGDDSKDGRVIPENGFNATIADSNDASEVARRVDQFLQRRSQMFADLKAAGASSVIDVSLEVGSETHYTNSIRFIPDSLGRLALLGVELQISGYPTVDE